MTNKQIVKTTEEKKITKSQFEEMVEYYVTAKEQEKQIKPRLALGTDIKKYMAEHSYEDYEHKNISVSISYRDNTSIDDDKALEILKKQVDPKYLKGLIKTKEYIDEEVLENLIYDGILPRDILRPALVKQAPTAVLKYKLKK